MSSPKISRLAFAGGAAAWVFWSALTASAWQGRQGAQTPTLPETEVEAAPAPVDGAPPASGIPQQPFDPTLPPVAPGSQGDQADPNAPQSDDPSQFNDPSGLPASESALPAPKRSATTPNRPPPAA